MNNDDFSTATQRADKFHQELFKTSKKVSLALAIGERFHEAMEAVRSEPQATQGRYTNELAGLLADKARTIGEAITSLGKFILSAQQAPDWITKDHTGSLEHMRAAFLAMVEDQKKWRASL
jgi:hypothetical protein